VNKIIFFLFTSLIIISGGAISADQNKPIDPKSFKRLSKEDFTYKGAFIMNRNARYGVSDNKYAAAIIELSADRSSFYFAGRKKDGAIAEFELPKLVISDNTRDLNITNEVKQNYSSVFNYGLKKKGACSEKAEVVNRIPTGNTQCINRITGMMLHDGMLVVNGIQYYDANKPNTHTTILIADPSDLKASTIYGFFSLDGAAHAAGWMSEVPPEWQQTLGGDILTGFASNFPIISRNSVGPSAFIVNSNDINPSSAPGSRIPAKTLMDFSLANPLHPDTCNNNQTALCTGKTNGKLPPEVGTNKLWTKKSWAVYGFIVPGTRTYAVFGSSGGHFSGIGYKIVEDNGNLCPGTCPVKSDDYYNYYWFFDVNDLVAVKNGKKQAYDVRPYDYGIFSTPFQTQAKITSRRDTPIRPIRGGDYDQKTNTLYLVLGGSIHAEQIIVAYSLKIR